MRITGTFLFIALLTHASATAGPITPGTWSVLPAPSNQSGLYFDNASWDCGQCGVAWQMSNVEYLHDPGDQNMPIGFAVPGPLQLTDLGGTSDYLPDHLFAHDPITGDFSLDNGNGYTARSSVAGNTVLFRALSAGRTNYWIWFEDLPSTRTDSDYQDRGVTWFELEPLAAPPASVPEPSTMMLLSAGALMLARRKYSVVAGPKRSRG